MEERIGATGLRFLAKNSHNTRPPCKKIGGCEGQRSVIPAEATHATRLECPGVRRSEVKTKKKRGEKKIRRNQSAQGARADVNRGKTGGNANRSPVLTFRRRQRGCETSGDCPCQASGVPASIGTISALSRLTSLFNFLRVRRNDIQRTKTGGAERRPFHRRPGLFLQEL